MNTIIYIDVLLLINLIIDYFLLLAVKVIIDDYSKRIRIFIGAVIASLSSLIILAPALHPLVVLTYKSITIAGIVLIAFKWKSARLYLKALFWYFFVNVLMAGGLFTYRVSVQASFIETNNLTFYINVSPLVLLLSVLVVYIAMKISMYIFGRPEKTQTYLLEIDINGNKMQVNTLYDTGFSVVDFITQYPVILVDKNAVSDKQLKKCLDTYFTFKEIQAFNDCKLRLLSIKTATDTSLIPCVTANQIKYNNTTQKFVTIAFTNTSFENGYQALAGKQLATKLGV